MMRFRRYCLDKLFARLNANSAPRNHIIVSNENSGKFHFEDIQVIAVPWIRRSVHAICQVLLFTCVTYICLYYWYYMCTCVFGRGSFRRIVFDANARKSFIFTFFSFCFAYTVIVISSAIHREYRFRTVVPFSTWYFSIVIVAWYGNDLEHGFIV